MAKKYYEGTDYTFNTDWGGDDSTGGAPLSGGAVQEVIKDKVKEIETSLGTKVGHIYKNDTTSKIEFWTSEKDRLNNTDGCKISEIVAQQKYSIVCSGDTRNRNMFMSNETDKTFVWYFKTKNIQDESSRNDEDVIIKYTFTHNDVSEDKTIQLPSNPQDYDGYKGMTRVELKLDDILKEGTNYIQINVTGVETRETANIGNSITLIEFDVVDNTSNNSLFTDVITINASITATVGTPMFLQYRLGNNNEWLTNNTVENGKGSEKVTVIQTIDISSLPEGLNSIEYYIGINVDGVAHKTKIQRIEFYKGERNLEKPQILFSFSYDENEGYTHENETIFNDAYQYLTYTLKYVVLNPSESETSLSFKNVNDNSFVYSIVKHKGSAEYTIQPLKQELLKIEVYDDDTNVLIRTFYINVSKSSMDITITTGGLRVDFNSVSKNNNSDFYNTWESNVDGRLNCASFNEDFDWSQGWTKDGLAVLEKSIVTFDYAPFPKWEEGSPNDYEFVGGDNGFTMELEFKTQNVTNENAVLCDMMDEMRGTCGFKITGTNFEFVTPSERKVSTRFKSDEMNRITIVINPRMGKDTNGEDAFRGLVELYVNGIMCGITTYTKGEEFTITKLDSITNSYISKGLTFEGQDDAEIVVKYIRTYNRALSSDDIVNNYILFRDNIEQMTRLYAKNNVLIGNKITPQSIINLGDIPFMIFVGRTTDKILPGIEGDKDINEDNYWGKLESVTDKGYEIDMDVIYYNPKYPDKNFKLIKACVRPQGTSSMYYPKKNYRIYTQRNSETRMFVSGGLKGDAGILDFTNMYRWDFGSSKEDTKWEPYPNIADYKNKLYSFKKNAQPVKCWCLKADFAETSSSHNTGIARLWGDTMKNTIIEFSSNKKGALLKTNAQSGIEEKYRRMDKIEEMPDVRTTIDGFPIVLFAQKSYDDTPIFIGKYNFNNDKSTESVFGFCDIDKEIGFTKKMATTLVSLEDEKKNPDINKFGETSEKKHTIDEMLDKYMCCVETLDNGNALANFTTTEGWEVEDAKKKKGWEKAFEFRYPEIPEEPNIDDYKKDGDWGGIEGGKEEYDEDLAKYKKNIVKWNNTSYKPFKHFAEWVVSTQWCDINGKKLDSITEEEAAKRKKRFNKEKWEHLDVWKVAAYYVYLMRFGAVDQVVKNSMLTSEGPFSHDVKGDEIGYWDSTDEAHENYGRFYKWYFINYDNDTIMGVKNDGSLIHDPDITRTSLEKGKDFYAYAGSVSTLWNNLEHDENDNVEDRDGDFMNIVQKVDLAISKVMSYKTAINKFDVEQVGQWCERIYNHDADYKYIGPYVGGWKYSGTSDEAAQNKLVDKLFMLQGSRTAHRRWWLSKRFNLLDGKWGSGEFSTKYVEVKCDYGNIGDTFSAIAGSNAYFGYKINNFDWGTPEGGLTTEYNDGAVINWKLQKIVNIGDPIGIYGSCDMKELNLQGISQYLNSVVFHFGTNNDLGNKLEVLKIGIPNDKISVKLSYEAYSDTVDEGGGVIIEAFDNFQEAYPEIYESDFEGDRPTYPTLENVPETEEAIKNGPQYFRIKGDNDRFTYFAKIEGKGIRNYSCTGITLTSLTKLQELDIRGYENMESLDLTSNMFITSVDAGYSGVKNITFAAGSRIKKLNASVKINTLKLEDCKTISYNNFTIEGKQLDTNQGNLLEISLKKCPKLTNHNSFMTFIYKWLNTKEVNKKSLTIEGLSWEINDFKYIEIFLNRKLNKLNLSGDITISVDKLTKDNVATIAEFKKSFPNIEVKVKRPYIFINGPEDIVAGDKTNIYKASIYPDNFELEAGTNIKFEIKNTNTNDERVIRFVDNGDNSITINTDETILPDSTIKVISKIDFPGGDDYDKSDEMEVIIKQPTYPQKETSYINGVPTMKYNAEGNEYEFEFIPLDDNGILSTGTYEIKWEISGDNVEEYLTTKPDGKNKYIVSVKKDIDDNTSTALLYKIKVSIEPYGKHSEEFSIEYETSILQQNVVISNASHPEIMRVLNDYQNNLNRFALSIDEAKGFTNTDLVNLNESFKKLKADSGRNMFSFDEFKYFTGITILPDKFFAESDLSSITLPESIEQIGTANGYNGETSDTGVGMFSGCTKLTNITFPMTDIFVNTKSDRGIVIPKDFCRGCTSLSQINLPENVLYIDDHAFAKTNITKIDIPNKVKGLGRAFVSDYFGSDSLIEEFHIPKSCLSLDPAIFMGDKLKKITVDEGHTIYGVDDYGCFYSYNNSTNEKTLLRMPTLNEVFDESDRVVTSFDFTDSDYTFIGVNAFRNVKNLKNIDLNNAEWKIYNGELKIKNLDTGSDENITEIYNALFENCENLEQVTIYSDETHPISLTERCFANCKSLEEVNLTDGIIKIGKHAFYNNAITKLEIPDTVTTMYGLSISKCEILEELILSKRLYKLETEKTADGVLIQELNNLKKLTLPFLCSKSSLPSSFISSCEKLEEYILPEGLATYNDSTGEITLHSNEEEMDSYLDEHTSDEVSNKHSVNNGVIYYTTESNGITRTTIVKIPFNVKTNEGILTFDEKKNITIIGDRAGYNLVSVKKVILPDDLKEIRQDGFKGSSLEEVVTNNNLETIGVSSFQECSNLKSFNNTGLEGTLIIPDTVESIGNSAFYGCNKLLTVVIGSGVKSMGTHPFAQCPNITEYYFKTQVLPKIAQKTWDIAVIGGLFQGSGTSYVLSDATYAEETNQEVWWEKFFERYIRKELTMDDIPSSTYSLRKPAVTITLYNNGAQFTSQEMYLINTNTGEKIVGILNGDHYNVVDLSKLYIGQPYAVMVSMDGMSYTFNDMIIFEFDVFKYEVDSKNGMNPYYDPSAIMASGIDDDMMGVGTVTNSSTISKYEYDVLSAKIAYLESILNKL